MKDADEIVSYTGVEALRASGQWNANAIILPILFIELTELGLLHSQKLQIVVLTDALRRTAEKNR